MNENSDNDAESNEEHNINDEIEEDDENESNESKTKKKKKKHKKNKKSKVDENVKKDSVNQGNEESSFDEIEETVRQINKLLGEPESSGSTATADNSQFNILRKTREQTLMVQHKHLNPYNELKRIFGSRTMQAEQV